MLEQNPQRPPQEDRPFSRRAVVKTIGAVTLAALGAPGARGAEAPQKVDIHDPKALALGYIENAGQVDLKKYPHFVAGSNCENCMQLQGKPGNNYRPCGLFSGGLVSVSGWCSGWAAEM